MKQVRYNPNCLAREIARGWTGRSGQGTVGNLRIARLPQPEPLSSLVTSPTKWEVREDSDSRFHLCAIFSVWNTSCLCMAGSFSLCRTPLRLFFLIEASPPKLPVTSERSNSPYSECLVICLSTLTRKQSAGR